MKVILQNYTPRPLIAIATAARTCYSKLPPDQISLSVKEAEKIVDKTIKSGHGSVLEHASFTFYISGVSKVLTHQLVRHRMASFCLSGDSIVLSDMTNRNVKKRTIKELYDMKPQYRNLIKIRCIDESNKEITNGCIKNIIYSGKQELFLVETEDGYSIKTTDKHRFLTDSGWKQLSEISIGDMIYTNGEEAYKNKEWLERKYIIENMKQTDIADLCRVSKHTIRAWVRKHGLTKEVGIWSVGVDPPNKGKNKENYMPLKRTSEKMKGNINCTRLFGSDNPAYKDIITAPGGYSRSNRNNPKIGICEDCGKTTATENHHIDLNPLNNNDENIIELCTKCHKCRHKGSVVKVVKKSKIKSITSIGIDDTYDIEMVGENHNFIANGIVVHNSQQSQRYVNMNDVECVYPFNDEEDSGITSIYVDAINNSKKAYKKLIELGVPEEDARYILPEACTTNIVVTMNARELLHFFKLRLCNRAQKEIREMAELMLKECMLVAPEIFKYAGAPCQVDKCHETKPCGHPKEKIKCEH